MTTPRHSIRWLVAELFVVVLGILIAFQLESVRGARRDRVAEAAALSSILEDLRRDSASLEGFAMRVGSQGRAVRRLGLHLDDTARLDRDSLLLTYAESIRSRIWLPDPSAYWGIRDSGQLQLITDQVLLSQIVDYFDGWEVYLSELGATLREATEEWRVVSSRDFVATSSGPEVSAPYTWSLVSPLDRVPSHPDARARLGDIIRWTWFLNDRIEFGFTRNAHLTSLIEQHLNSSR